MRLANSLYTGQYIQITFPVDSLTDLDVLSKCNIKTFLKKKEGSFVNPIVQLKPEVNKVEVSHVKKKSL